MVFPLRSPLEHSAFVLQQKVSLKFILGGCSQVTGQGSFGGASGQARVSSSFGFPSIFSKEIFVQMVFLKLSSMSLATHKSPHLSWEGWVPPSFPPRPVS